MQFKYHYANHMFPSKIPTANATLRHMLLGMVR